MPIQKVAFIDVCFKGSVDGGLEMINKQDIE